MLSFPAMIRFSRVMILGMIAVMLCAGCQTNQPNWQPTDDDQPPQPTEPVRHHHQAPARDLSY